LYDDIPGYSNHHHHAMATPIESHYHSSPLSSPVDVLVEAEALPPDWNAQTAEVVNIPMAEAIVIGPSSSAHPSAQP
jgi:hypothetical protein